MTTFAYEALDPAGKRRSGEVEAKDRDSAIAAVLAEGRYVVDIKEAKPQAVKRSLGQSRKVSKSELALFSRRLADLAAAGLPLDRVLKVVSEQSESVLLSEVALSALEEVRAGASVSQALAKFPRLFPPVYTETLRAGEASGQFAEVASRLADFQEKEVAIRSQIVAAMIYPAVLAGTALSVIIFLVTFVVPRLSGVFESIEGGLPITTQILLGTTEFITTQYLWILGAVVGLIVMYRTWAATETGAITRDRFILKSPVLGKVITKAVISRYARVLGTLVFGGVPILEALRLSGLAAGNRVFQKTSDSVAEDVRDGRSIHDAMKDSGVFPPVLTHMVAIGEETGDLPKMLGRVSDSLDFEVENGVRKLTALVEPVIVLFMGGFVGFVILSILLPIFAAQNNIR